MEPDKKISKQDIEDKIRVLQSDLSGRATEKKQAFMTIAVVASVTVVLLSFLLGRRSGRRRGSRVEFRRF